MTTRIADRIRRYINDRWYIKRCILEGLINKSALARKITKELNIDSFDAVHMALRRTRIDDDSIGRKIQWILTNSRIEVRTGIEIAIGKDNLQKVIEVALEAYSHGEEFHLLQQPRVWVAIAPAQYTRKLKEFSFKYHEDVVELVIRSPEEIEEVPGVLSEILDRFRSRKINIIEFLSCWSDTILIIDKDTLQEALEALEGLIKQKI